MPSAAPLYYDHSRPLWRTILQEAPIVLAINLTMAVICCVFLYEWYKFWLVLIISNFIGFGIYSSMLFLRCLSVQWRLSQAIFLPLVCFVGIPLGYVLGDSLAGLLISQHHSVISYAITSRSLINSAALAIIGGGIGMVHFSGKWKLVEQQRRTEEAKRAAVEARLRILQTQVEPHFLFNTLANLDALIGIDPKQARVLLKHLNHYLRSSLTYARSAQCTLGEEFSQLENYLSIMEIRMPDRFKTRIDCTPGCANLPLAPMLLQPLVENAIKHGIEPSTSGGEINLSAKINDDMLVLEVCDSGIGLDQAPQNETNNGTGLANIRERLNALYGPRAHLDLSALEPHGTRAMINIPLATLKRDKE